jgi:hypothetical protein
MLNSVALPPSDSGTFPAIPTGPRWMFARDIAITSARTRGVSETAIRSVCERFSDTQYATRRCTWWSARFDEASRAEGRRP